MNMAGLRSLWIFLLVVVSLGCERSTGVQEGFPPVNLPHRPKNAVGGKAFYEKIKEMEFWEREEAIQRELLKGNIPTFLRQWTPIQTSGRDGTDKVHSLMFWVLPDYLAIGSDQDFFRIPMSAITAQQFADSIQGILPTRKMVDMIFQQSTVRLAPITYYPVGNENEQVEKFYAHQRAIQTQLKKTDWKPGQLLSGIKKDLVTSRKIQDSARIGHIVLYGWHHPDGSPIQPLTNIHHGGYVDYSHGARIVANQMLLDGDTTTVEALLKDPILHSLLNNEEGPFQKVRYPLNPPYASKIQKKPEK